MTATKARRPYTSRHYYTPEEIAFIRESFIAHGREETISLFAERYGVRLTVSQFKNTVQRAGIKAGRPGGFKKGNKIRRINSAAPHLEAFRFKKGCAIRSLPIGSECVDSRRQSRQYVYVKVAQPNVWRLKHQVVWEKAHGREIPTGHVVMFGDGNTRNFEVDNLILVSREELGIMAAQRLYFPDAEMTRTGAALAALQVARNKIVKNKPKTERV
ncbi:MAG: HNH endonuclease [Chitinispirillia bacterium]|nr:HNH endonuclease [Chitinispirillia bacterium]